MWAAFVNATTMSTLLAVISTTKVITTTQISDTDTLIPTSTIKTNYHTGTAITEITTPNPDQLQDKQEPEHASKKNTATTWLSVLNGVSEFFQNDGYLDSSFDHIWPTNSQPEDQNHNETANTKEQGHTSWAPWIGLSLIIAISLTGLIVITTNMDLAAVSGPGT